MKTRSRLPACIAALLWLSAAACTDRSRNPLAPTPDPGDGGSGTPLLVALDCTASMASKAVACAPAAPDAGGASADIIVGGQNTYVTLTGTNLVYNAGTGQYTFNVTLKNLMEQPIETFDGVTPSAMRVFFHSGPTVTAGTGVVAVIPDGFADFTGPSQAFYNFAQTLDKDETSPADTWTFVVQPTVVSFAFKLYVSAPVQWPSGYVTLDGLLPGAPGGDLRPGDTRPLVALVKNAVGTVVPGDPVVFASTDPTCLTVTGVGAITGQRAGLCQVTATSGVRPGGLNMNVTGIVRTWSGALSGDWFTAGNWTGGWVPAAVDSVTIPAGAANMPQVTAAATIAGVSVADAATLTLGAFDLTVNADLSTGATGGVTSGGTGRLVLAGSGKTAAGRVPATLVTGTYSLSGDLTATAAPQTIRSGQVRGAGYQLRITNQ